MVKRKHKVILQGSETVVEKTKFVQTPTTSFQEKKATDAFKLMMNSRNKSFGGNSPGNEKISDTSEKQEEIEKKEMKVKKPKGLQKLAESKRSLKNKELEEYEWPCITIKMEKRAERIKSMIKKNDKFKKVKEKTRKSKTEDTIGNKTPKKKDQLIDLFSDDSLISNESDDDSVLSDVKLKLKSKEYEDFLKPSVRKKENMLCYLKKVDKRTDTQDPHKRCRENDINVKVTQGNRKRNNLRKKLSLNKQSEDVLKSVTQNTESCNEVVVTQAKNSERRKRKRNENSEDVVCVDSETNKFLQNSGLAEVNKATEGRGRSKRSIIKAIKYIDDVNLSSSDEELHIITPKRRKPLEGNSQLINEIREKKDICLLERMEKNPAITKEKNCYKNQAKLAPIFNSKPQPTPEEIEAKKKFLCSGVPEQLKKIIIHKTKNIQNFVSSHPLVVHIQQKETSLFEKPILPSYHLQLGHNTDEDETPCAKISLRKFLSLSENLTQTFNAVEDCDTLLQNLKNLHPKFPVYRTYRLLRDKCKGVFKDASCPEIENSMEAIKGSSGIIKKNPDNLTWTDKYKAFSTKQLIGNINAVKDLKKWLISWTKNEVKPQRPIVSDSDSSDFFYDSDIDSKDNMKTIDNLLIISGPVGCGKSSTVYAVAEELSIKVIEVNVSSKRTGKMMLQDLQEATQSHKVNRGASNAENSQKSLELEKPLKTYQNRGRPKKGHENLSKVAVAKKSRISSLPVETSQDDARTDMSLIMLDDADIVFDQDDGFSSAIGQLVYSSKRPVILITSSLSCLHLQRFVQYGRVLNMHALLPRILGTWLDILCLADRSICWPGLGAKFLNHFKGDIRKSINSLQFYLSSEAKQSAQDNIGFQNTEINIADECFTLSWAEKEGVDERVIKQTDSELKHRAWRHFMGGQINSLENYFNSELFSVWWSIPSLLHLIYRSSTKGQKNYNTAVKSLETVAKVLETLSLADHFNKVAPDIQKYICTQPWCEFESDSVSELEDLRNYSRSSYMNKEILNSFITDSVLLAQKTLQMKSKTDIEQPGMLEQRQRSKKISRHDCLTSILNPSSVLDRKALALDYWATCRSICRIEKMKTDGMSKRKNRFCHYLKSASAVCETDSLDKLCYSLKS